MNYNGLKVLYQGAFYTIDSHSEPRMFAETKEGVTQKGIIFNATLSPCEGDLYSDYVEAEVKLLVGPSLLLTGVK